MIMAPGLFFIMMGILILIRIIVGLRMSKLGYCNHKNSAASLWLMVFLGVILCIIVIGLFVYQANRHRQVNGEVDIIQP